jgi:hypothetical protein
MSEGGWRVSGDGEPFDPLLDVLWRRVLETWEEPRVHAAALEQAVRRGSLPELAGRYRALLADPSKHDVAQSRLDAIVAAALLMLEEERSPPRAKVPLGITLSAAATCVLLVGWVLWLVSGPR